MIQLHNGLCENKDSCSVPFSKCQMPVPVGQFGAELMSGDSHPCVTLYGVLPQPPFCCDILVNLLHLFHLRLVPREAGRSVGGLPYPFMSLGEKSAYAESIRDMVFFFSSHRTIDI